MIQLMPQLLETAEVNLRRQSYVAFFPRVLIAKSRKTSVTEPMFRGYGFVKFDPLVDQWGPINGTRGVIGLLPRHALVPLAMPEGFVERLQLRDPTPESDFVEVFEEFFPGITEVEVVADHKHLGGRRGLLMADRGRTLQVAFAGVNGEYGRGVWVDRDDVVVPTKRRRVT